MAAFEETIYLVNDQGLNRIKVGSNKVMCMGASPPFDHPHEFIDLKGGEKICPYCSTVIVYDGTLKKGDTVPSSARYD